MAQVRMIAKKTGYYNNVRIREGVEFYMDDALFKYSKEGLLLSPSWADYADKPEIVNNKKPKAKFESKVTEDVI